MITEKLTSMDLFGTTEMPIDVAKFISWRKKQIAEKQKAIVDRLNAIANLANSVANKNSKQLDVDFDYVHIYISQKYGLKFTQINQWKAKFHKPDYLEAKRVLFYLYFTYSGKKIQEIMELFLAGESTIRDGVVYVKRRMVHDEEFAKKILIFRKELRI